MSKRVFLGLAIAFGVTLQAQAQVDVLTWHNDNSRTGQDLYESILTPANVNVTTFGLLVNIRVDGKVDAQPLYASGIDVKGLGVHNVLYVATEHDSVYALDAQSGATLWKKSLLGSGETTSDTRNCDQVVPEIGITSTPVIDRKAGPHGTIYVVAMSKDLSRNYYQRIHALDLSTAAEEFNGPVVVKATYPGNGDGSANGTVTFNPGQFKDRPGLLEFNGTIYTTWGSHCDIRPYGGWMMTYDELTLAQTAAIDFAPNGSDAAPWNAGAGPAADNLGNVYVSLGNGTFDTTLTTKGFPSQGDYGNALVKLKFTGSSLIPQDYWTMYNSNAESGKDTDLGSGGLLLLPEFTDASGVERKLLVAAGKDHNLYVADQTDMGHYDASVDATIYQQLTDALPGGMWSSPAYFNSHVYFGSKGQNLRSFTVSQAKLVGAPVQTTSTVFEYPGTTPSISAYGTSNAIVWAAENSSQAVLHAYDANNLNTELYNSSQAANHRDQFGAGNKFIVPTIANGKVYVGTQNSVGIFGFLRLQAPLLPDGDYTLTSGFSKLLVQAPSATANVAVNQFKADGEADDEWYLSFDGNGYYTMESLSNKLFLTGTKEAGGASTAVLQSAPTHDATQLWSLTASGTSYVVTNKSSGLVLEATSTSAGANVALSSPDGSTNQTWSIH